MPEPDGTATREEREEALADRILTELEKLVRWSESVAHGEKQAHAASAVWHLTMAYVELRGLNKGE
jgi:hypothetical protein